MKKIGIIGILVMVLLFAVTCDEDLPEAVTEEIVYTNVEYSKDGSQVTIWIDGSMPVPVTKVNGRAMSKDLAEMAFDFIEVVFVSPSNGIARTSWEIGEAAGISGVYRTGSNDTGGINYGTITTGCMFVGKGSSMTLLGVGGIKEHYEGGTVNAVTAGGTITLSTISVTFQLGAVITGLRTNDDDAARIALVTQDSFSISGTGTSSSLLPLGNGATPYPLYTLPTTAGSYDGVYKFALSGTTTSAGYWAAVIAEGPSTPFPGGLRVVKREPRFMDGGTYKQPKDHTDTKTKITVNTSLTAGQALNITSNNIIADGIELEFAVIPSSGGLFSFLIEIPVFMVTKTLAGRSGDLAAEQWYLRTGYGPDLYSLDDGISSGGCVLMGVGASTSDWINIIWEWI